MAISCAIGRRGRCTLVVCVALLTASLSVGCGKSRPEIKGKLPLFPVKGKVTMDGQPMSGATLLFYPTQDFPKGSAQQRPRAVVEDDGTFQVSTYANNDGAGRRVQGHDLVERRHPGPQQRATGRSSRKGARNRPASAVVETPG